MSSFFLPSLFIPLLFTSPGLFLFAYLRRKLNITIPRLALFRYNWNWNFLILFVLSILSAILSAILAPTTLPNKFLIVLYQSVVLITPFFNGGYVSTIYLSYILPFFYLGVTVPAIWGFVQSGERIGNIYLLFLAITYAFTLLFFPDGAGSAKVIGINGLSRSLLGIEVLGASSKLWDLVLYASLCLGAITLIAHSYYLINIFIIFKAFPVN